MLTGSAVAAALVKALPLLITMKVIGGVVDVSVHYMKVKISKGANKNEKI